jgi:hypothetical protein
MPIKPDITTQTETFRKATAGQLWLDHRRKHCYCGKTITAKQQAQYGCCDACYQKSKQATEAA